MNSRYWKNSLRQINSGLDKCDATLEALNKNNQFDGVVSKEIYKSPDTLVEVNIRTTKKSKSPGKTSNLRVTSTKVPNHHPKYQRNAPPSRKTGSLKFGGTSISSTKENVSLNNCSTESRQVTFQHRTLKLVLAEIKSTLKQGDVDQALQHLEDVEYIALNLNYSSSSGKILKASSPCKKVHVSPERDELDASVKSKVSSLEKEKQDLQSELTHVNIQLDQAIKVKTELHKTLDSHERKIDEMKSLISRLSSTNEDMVLHLKEKIQLEDSVKVLEVANQQLSLKYETIRSQNAATHKALKKKESETKALQRAIEDMKKSFSQDYLDRPIKHISFQEEAPSLNSDISKFSIYTDSSRKTPSAANNFSTESDEGVFSESVALPQFQRSPPTKEAAKKSRIEEEEGNSEEATTTNYGDSASFVKNDLNAKVQNFLERMKKTSPLEFSLTTPQRKSFDEMTQSLNLTEDTSNASGGGKSMESSLFLSSNESSGS